MKAIKISPDKTVTECEVSTLKELQEAVKGYIEAVTLRDGTTMYVNEEFLFSFGPEDFNSIASDVCGIGGRADLMLTGILGPVIIVGPVDSEGNSTDVTETARRWVKRVGREAGAKWQ